MRDLKIVVEVDYIKINDEIGLKRAYNVYEIGVKRHYLGTIVVDGVYEHEYFEVLTKFILYFINTDIQYYCSYDCSYSEEEFDRYSFETHSHVFCGRGTIDVQYGDFDNWVNSKLEEYLTEVSKLLNVDIKVVRKIGE